MEIFLLIWSNLPHLLIGLYFFFMGVWNVYHWFTTMEEMTERGIAHPYVVLPICILWQAIAGAMIIGALFVKIAALSLILYTVISVFLFHPFWKLRGEHRNLHFNLFFINLTVTLAALILLILPVVQVGDLLV